MVDLMQWRSTIGCFYSKYKCYIGRKYTNNAFENGMLHTALNGWFNCTMLHVKRMLHTTLNNWFDFAVLHMPVFIIYVVSMQLLCSGDVEVNPGPVYVACPNCNIQVHIRKKVCECGYKLFKAINWTSNWYNSRVHQVDTPYLMLMLK